MKRGGPLGRDPEKVRAWRQNSKPLKRRGNERRDPEWLGEARKMRSEGFSFLQIAAMVGATRNQVYYYLERREKFTYTCEICGSEFKTGEEGQRTCSRTCHFKLPTPPEVIAKRVAALPDRRGKANPNYRHGRRVGGHERKLAREFNIRKKGEERCRVCGATSNLQAHHAVPRSIAPAGKYDLRNCLPLCASCHQGWHRHGLVIYRDIFTSEEWEFVESIALPSWLDKRYPAREEACPEREEIG